MVQAGEGGLNHEYMGSTGAPPAAWQGPEEREESANSQFSKTPHTQNFGHPRRAWRRATRHRQRSSTRRFQRRGSCRQVQPAGTAAPNYWYTAASKPLSVSTTDVIPAGGRRKVCARRSLSLPKPLDWQHPGRTKVRNRRSLLCASGLVLVYVASLAGQVSHNPKQSPTSRTTAICRPSSHGLDRAIAPLPLPCKSWVAHMGQ